MDATDGYRWLMSAELSAGCDGFDVHVLASALALGIEAKQQGASLVETLGIEPELLRSVVSEYLPHALRLVDGVSDGQTVVREPEEEMLQSLLWRHASASTPLEACFAALIARRAQAPHHLWQEMGLRRRDEISWLLERHFEALAIRNVRGMKWKKFLYRAICHEEGYSLCTAPSCGECNDFDHCFGDENGDALLAISRRDGASTTHQAHAAPSGEPS